MMRNLTSVWCCQAGVDLGTVLEEQQTAAGRKGNRGKGAAVEVRPKRRAPITQVPSLSPKEALQAPDQPYR